MITTAIKPISNRQFCRFSFRLIRPSQLGPGCHDRTASPIVQTAPSTRSASSADILGGREDISQSRRSWLGIRSYTYPWTTSLPQTNPVDGSTRSGPHSTVALPLVGDDNGDTGGLTDQHIGTDDFDDNLDLCLGPAEAGTERSELEERARSIILLYIECRTSTQDAGHRPIHASLCPQRC